MPHNHYLQHIRRVVLIGGQGFDARFKAIVALTVQNQRIQDGLMYEASRYVASVANNANVDVLIRVGAKPQHLCAKLSAGGDALFGLYEAPTVTNDGTPITAFNRNREVVTPPLSVFTHSPTVTAPGVAVRQQLLPGGSGNGSQGRVLDDVDEWVLKRNTAYLLRLTNLGGNGQPLYVGDLFYEFDQAAT